MKHKEIAHDIRHQFNVITKLVKKSTQEFDEDIIHDFRVEVKKLRAFLRLISTGKDSPIKMHKPLKQFYRHAGTIRSIQLYLYYIKTTLPYVSHHIDPYLQLLQTEMDEWEKEAKALTPDHADLEKEESDILDSLPDKLSNEAIKTFVTQKATTINAILALETPAAEDLHALRKEVKDIQYTWPYIKDEAPDILPSHLNSHDNIHAVTEMLGLYHDKYSALEFLQSIYSRAVPDGAGHAILEEMRTLLEKEMSEQYSAFLEWRATPSSTPPSPG